jgi:hypothetical protein
VPIKLTSFSGDETPPPIRGLRKKATGAQNNYSSSNAGGPKSTGSKGGGNKGSKVKKTKRSDVVDRYKEITDQLDDI